MSNKLINWSELSRLKGDRNLIRANKIPKKYQPKIRELTDFVEKWVGEFTDTNG